MTTTKRTNANRLPLTVDVLAGGRVYQVSCHLDGLPQVWLRDEVGTGMTLPLAKDLPAFVRFTRANVAHAVEFTARGLTPVAKGWRRECDEIAPAARAELAAEKGGR